MTGTRKLLKLRLNLRSNRRLWLQPDELIDLLTIFEEQDRRDGHYLEHRAQFTLFIHVDLGDSDIVTDFCGDFIQQWGQLLAWTTPFSPKIYDHELVGVNNSAARSEERRVGKESRS